MGHASSLTAQLLATTFTMNVVELIAVLQSLDLETEVMLPPPETIPNSKAIEDIRFFKSRLTASNRFA